MSRIKKTIIFCIMMFIGLWIAVKFIHNEDRSQLIAYASLPQNWSTTGDSVKSNSEIPDMDYLLEDNYEQIIKCEKLISYLQE